MIRVYSLLLLAAALLFPLLAFKCIQRCTEGLATFQHSAWSLHLLDNSGAEPVESTGNLFPRQAFGLRVKTRVELVNPQDTVGLECPDFVADTPVVDAKIIALANFDAQHPAGSDLSAFFKVRRTVGEAPEKRLNNYFVNYQPLASLGAVLDQYEYAAPADLLLLTPPEGTYTGAFELRLIRSDNSNIILTTPVVTLKN